MCITFIFRMDFPFELFLLHVFAGPVSICLEVTSLLRGVRVCKNRIKRDSTTDTPPDPSQEGNPGHCFHRDVERVDKEGGFM